MKKLISSRFGILLLVIVLAGINYMVSFFPARLDLTAEQRYTLSKPTKRMLMDLPAPVTITVFLKGEFPAGFRKLANSAEDMLRSFKEYGRGNFSFRFVQPGEGMEEDAKAAFLDSLRMMGLNPLNVKAQAKEGEGSDQRLVYPGALISYEDRVYPVDLLQGLSSNEGLNTLNSAEALLEYKFAGAIEKVLRDSVPIIAYATGNGEIEDARVEDLTNVLLNNYYPQKIDLNATSYIPDEVGVLLIVKPTIAFTESEKLKIDQYLMGGGKVVMALDPLNAEFDSLQRAQSDFIAFDRGLNLQDQLFKYGIRINPDLVQDIQSDKVPLVVGVVGGKPQMELIPFPYFVQLNGTQHPISKNLDKVLSYFPSSIDTVTAPGVSKTMLLTTSKNARALQTPAIVSLNSVKKEEDLATFIKPDIPVGVLAEGAFPSMFTNRLPKATADSLKAMNRPFRTTAAPGATLVVLSDGDIFLNHVNNQEGPLPMGVNPYTRYPFANKEFFQNMMEYLVSRSGILETRSKDFTLRLIDAKKAEQERTYWQLFNIALPVALMIALIAVFQWRRKKKYN